MKMKMIRMKNHKTKQGKKKNFKIKVIFAQENIKFIELSDNTGIKSIINVNWINKN